MCSKETLSKKEEIGKEERNGVSFEREFGAIIYPDKQVVQKRLPRWETSANRRRKRRSIVRSAIGLYMKSAASLSAISETRELF